MRALPGVTLGPTSTPGLAFTSDGSWLIVAASEGDTTRLLLYTADGDGPYDPHITAAGAALRPWIVGVSK